MTTKKAPVSPETCCCQVDAVVTVDSRGQLVLPKELRDKAAIKDGDKFAVISYRSGTEVCCIFLVRADYFSKTIQGALGPMMKEIMQ
ncbi:MAG: HgcAB-associated protein [Dehalococcoidales bacterium]|nr:HgcAB-associated protein [Dehalococcoidales bacterium]